MAFDKPQSRNEAILQNMLGANNELEPPKSRVEALLQEIAGQMPEANPSEGTTTGTLERLKIGDDIYTVEGGGSGTSDYDALNNKPQIAGTTLSGNKSLADLGIASATAVSGILDGTDIDSFGDVETALDDKVDKVNGKGLSTNDYDDTEKAAVTAATTAIAGIKDGTTIDSFGDVETALGAIQDGQSIDSFADVESAIGAIEDGTTIDSFADVENALADKQDATDSNLQTTADTIVGAINEHEGDIDSLKSGFTNLDNEVNGDATVYPYADVITIEDAVPANLADCSVKIEPVQDLHGQSAPYVGGASKNKLPLVLADIKAVNTDGTWNGNTYTHNDVAWTILTDDADNVTGVRANGTASNISYLGIYTITVPAGSYASLVSDTDVNVTLQTRLNDAGGSDVGLTTKTTKTATFSESTTIFNRLRVASGDTVSNATVYPMLASQSEPLSVADWQPYTNVCPISGHTEVDVQRDGVNLWEFAESYSGSGGLDSNLRFSNSLKPNTYVLSCKGTFASGGAIQFTFMCEDGSKPSITLGYDKVGDTYYSSRTFTKKIVGIDNIYSNNAGNSINDVQFELGSTATPYEPYQGKTYTIALGDTVYGGTVDFDSGVMTVDRAYCKIKDFSSIIYSATANSMVIANDNRASKTEILSSAYVAKFYSGSQAGIYSLPDNKIYYQTSNNNIFVTYRDSTDTAQFISDCGDYDVVYYIKNPFTIQLTPQQIQLLQGQNTLTASTGDISVTVNGVAGSIGAVQEQVNNTDAALAELAEKLPTAPTTDGAYVLTVTVADGTPTYSWESAT